MLYLDVKTYRLLVALIMIMIIIAHSSASAAETNAVADSEMKQPEPAVAGALSEYQGRRYGLPDQEREEIIRQLGMGDMPRHSIEPIPIDSGPDGVPDQQSGGKDVMTPKQLERDLQSPQIDEPKDSDALDDGGKVDEVQDSESAGDLDTDEEEPVEPSLDLSEVEDLNTSDIRELYYDGLYDVQDELYDQAIPKLEKVIAMDPTLYGAWESLGWSYWKTGREDETLKLWNRLKLLDPEHPLPYVLLASLSLEHGNLEEARHLYEVALSKTADESFMSRMYNVRFSYARLLYWQGSIAKAIDLFEELLEEDPERTDVVLALARAYLQTADYAKALPLWTRLHNLADQNTEYLASEALCLLNTGARDEAVEKANRALEIEPENERAIRVLISRSMFGETPEDALPYLEKLYRQQSEGEAKDTVRHQLIVLYVYLHRQDPSKFSLAEPIKLSRERLEQNPDSVDAMLMLAELLLMDDQLVESHDLFEGVVEDLNPRNLRAQLGLFEIYLVARKYDKARVQYEYIRRFDPHNMYLFYYLARIESTRGNFYEANKMLEKLAEAGSRGAVAVLLYHGISSSDFTQNLPLEKFQQQIQALHDYRFKFITPDQIPEYVAEHSSDSLEDYSPELAVSVTFDDARRDSLEYADSVARQMGVRFAMHFTPPYINDENAFFVSWDELRDYNNSGYWVLGSHLQNCSKMVDLNGSGLTGYPLANRLWLLEEGRAETREEYLARLDRDYRMSKEILQDKLGNSGKIDFMAYPRGDIGQGTRSNAGDAIDLNVQVASEYYDIGFVQSGFGFAINGDNPLLYQRYSVDRWDSGQDVVDHIYMNHPVYLSWRKRAEYAAFEGKQYRAQAYLKKLKDVGYPEGRYKELKKFVHDRLSRRLAAPQDVGSVSDGPLHLRLRDPFIGVQFNYFEDNQDRKNWSAYLEGGLNLTSGLEIQGKAGVGELKQTVRTFDHPEYGNELVFDEKDVGGKAIYTFENGLYVSGEAIDRQYTSPRKDNSVLAYEFETQFRPILAADIMFLYGYDMEPSALSVWDDITREQLMGVGVFRIRDWWDASLAGIRYDYSDDNVRDHIQFGTRFFVWPRTGLNIGLKYAYADSDKHNTAYWTPYKLHRYFIEPGFHGTYLRSYYDFRVRLGLGRESVRPEAKVAYSEAVDRAAAGGYEPFRDEPPSEDWEAIFGVSASWDIPFTKYWYFNGRLGYNEGPSYNEFRAHLGLKLKL